ncbi:MAG: alpha/beta hydrolase [Flavihumibacter sp.]
MLLETAQGTLYYHRFGEGPRQVIGLHGYGETGAHFATLGALLGKEYSLLCPDLPLHGQTNWTAPLEPETFLALIHQLCEKENWRTENLMVMGYSMGARLWLAGFFLHPEKFNRLILAAPDGLVVNPWYRFATQTPIGNRVFRNTMLRPGWFFKATALAQKTRLLNDSVFKFIHRYLDDPQQRKQLYERWIYFRHFHSHPAATTRLIRRHQVPVQLIVGQHDRIIPPALGKRWQQQAGPSCRLHILPAGHRLLQGEPAETVAACILQTGES